jgi:two-component system, OmpR family, sensor histidine kinase VicK
LKSVARHFDFKKERGNIDEVRIIIIAMDSKSKPKEYALCGNPLKRSVSLVEEKIGSTNYRFDTNDCASIFKRFLAIYGDDFGQPFGQTASIFPTEREFKAIKKREKKRRRVVNSQETSEFVSIIQDPIQVQKLLNELINSAREKIQILVSSTNLFYHYIPYYKKESHGGFQIGEKTKKGIDVKIITPAEKRTSGMSFKSNTLESLEIQIRYIEEIDFLDNNIILLVVDGKHSLAINLKEEKGNKDKATVSGNTTTSIPKETFEEIIDLGTYSTNISTVLFYATIFETLWKELELNEKISNLFEKSRSQESSKSDFLSIAAHELRDPIQPVLGLAEMLQSRKKVDPHEQEEFSAIIIRNAKRLKALTENILDLTRIECQSSLNLHRETVDLQEVIRDAASDIKSQLPKNHMVMINVEDSFGEEKLGDTTSGIILLQADRFRLTQVVSNLLTNAIKFTELGTVLIKIETRLDDSNNRQAIVSIKDNGPGIDPSIAPRLFEKFATKSDKSSGLGLGLFVSKSIIESHGGKIWAHNNADGKGATFTFSLPLSA